MNRRLIAVGQSGRRPAPAHLAVLGFAGLGLAGCTETPVSAPLRSLEGSDDVAFVCLGADGSPRSINDCPDFSFDGSNHMFALVTQEKGEVAVIDLSTGGIVDADPSAPGFTFLHVGATPRDIVATPGGAATFVGTAEVGREGIFALPSSCLGPALAGQTVRDLTTWPACRLPEAPGSMAILIDPPDASGLVREICPNAPPGTPRDGALTAGNECPADLSREPGPVGRRKLAVALPELGRIDIYDAQAILNREPGSFQNCDIDLEQSIPLRVDLPTTPIRQRLPADLAGPGCGVPELNYGPPPDRFESQPAGFALGEGTLYVGDRTAPVIHVLGVADPCAVVEYPTPLLPLSFEGPRRVVKTTEVALSPPTPRGERFLYAIDWDDPNGRSVMAFNVTPGAVDRTPIVRPGALRQTFEPPDRIRFPSPVEGIAFGLRDLPAFDGTGVGADPYCNPDPRIPDLDPGALYRPDASPANLRGVFGFLMLKNGEVQVIDVDDFDAACRRPTAAVSGPTPDFHGCSNDDPALAESGFVLGDGTPTVTNEVTCGVVQPHRARMANLVLTDDDNGVHAPTLRTLPRFSSPGEPEPDRSVYPKLLAVDYPSRGATPVFAPVYVGTELFTTDPDAENKIDTDPATAEENSLVLPWAEPRSYPTADEMALTYEGLFATRSTGKFALDGDRLLDNGGGFCTNAGIQDVALAREWGQELGLEREIDLEAFAVEHADFVQITSDVLAADNTYWQSVDGAACVEGRGHAGCSELFGQVTADSLAEFPSRELRIREGYQVELVIEPRTALDPAERARRMADVKCCFPSFFSYEIHGSKQWILLGSASRFRHGITASAPAPGTNQQRCIRDCRPAARLRKGRAVEMPLLPCDPNGAAACPPCSLAAELAPEQSRAVKPGDPRAACIFETGTARFAIYQGVKEDAPFESDRDMAFKWTTSGGFAALRATLTSQTSTVSPANVVFVPQLGQLAVVDGAAAGLSFISLETIGVSRLFF